MICASIQNKSLDEIFGILPEIEMAEIRLDRCPLSDEDIEELFSCCDVPLIATCRINEVGAKEAQRKLLLAIEAGAKFVDLEIEADAPIGKKIRHACVECGSILIRSFHDFNGTPPVEVLSEILSKCIRFGGEMVKIVTTAKSDKDWETVRRLYGEDLEGRLIAFCMGDKGRDSRIECLALGAPFTYASLSDREQTAEGQLSKDELERILYSNHPHYHNGGLTMPASKSFAQRAIIAAALADGTSNLSGYTPSDDSEAAIKAAEAFGAKISRKEDILTIKANPKKPELKELHTGESGLLTRLMIPLLSLGNKDSVRIDGEGTLLRRPLTDANEIMAAFGVVLENCGNKKGKEIYVPVQLSGELLPGRADISGKGGSQLISGLLMALPLADGNSTLFVHEPKSIPYMFITTDVLKKFGIAISSEMEGDDEFLESQDWSHCSDVNFKIKGGQKYSSADFHIEGDWSSAANYMVAGAVFGSVEIGGLDTSSLQADLSIMDILVEAGASISQDENGNINVFKAPLNSFNVDLSNSPDLFPIVSILAAFCPGRSHLSGAGRLAGKESNRAEAIMEMLGKMGVKAEYNGDEIIIEGHSLSSRLLGGNLLRGGDYASHDDHRIVMALKVAELGADSPLTISNPDCVSKSYPEFFKDF